jgi:hypothetical protein
MDVAEQRMNEKTMESRVRRLAAKKATYSTGRGAELAW